MKSVSGRFCTSENVLRDADAVFKSLGLSRSRAVDLFLREVARRQGLPFEAELPNDATRAAIASLECGEGECCGCVEDFLKTLG